MSLFDNLLTQGKLSILEAMYVGAAIEEVDMLDLLETIDNTDNDHIRRMYENILRDSRNHLRTYINQIEEHGNVNEALFLSQDEIDAVMQKKQEATHQNTLLK